MKVYVKNIDKSIEKIWGPIYEVIDTPFFEETAIFPHYFHDLCKDPNQPQLLPYDVKIVLKIMAMEQGLYAQVVMICQKDLDDKK